MAPITLPPQPIQAVYCFLEEDSIQRKNKKNSRTINYSDYLNTQIRHRTINTQSVFKKEIISSLILKFVEDTRKHYKQKDEEYLESITKAFVSTMVKLSSLNFDKIGVESNKNSVFFIARKNGFNVHYEVFINHELEKEQFEVVLNIFKDKKQFLSLNGGENFIFNKLMSSLSC